MTRTFIALELDEPVQRFLVKFIRQLADELPGLRWVDPADIHLTLAFLGELTDEQLAAAIQATEMAAQQIPLLAFRLKGLGVFGSPRQPRVIWMGIQELPFVLPERAALAANERRWQDGQELYLGQSPESPLHQLHRILNNELEQRSFEVEKRPFSPHLTLSRVKNPLTLHEQQILQRLLAGKQVNSPMQQVKHVSVMKSELLRAGAKYTCLRSCPLP